MHTWRLARLGDVSDWRGSFRFVGQVMTGNLTSVHPEDVIDLAVSLMDWERIRHLPVEDNEGHLVGIVTHRTLLRLLARGGWKVGSPISIREIMHPEPITVTPETTTLDAIEAMRVNRVGCLPVVEDGKLVGIVTERDFINISRQLLEESLREMEEVSSG